LFRVVNERHIPATSEQTRNAEAAAKDPALSLSQNHGHPTVAATPHPAEFKGFCYAADDALSALAATVS